MALWQNPVLLAVLVVIILALLFSYLVLRSRRKKREELKTTAVKSPVVVKAGESNILPVDNGPKQKAVTPVIDQDNSGNKPEKEVATETGAETGEQFDQIINADINLIPDVVLNPGEDTVLLILPERVPVEEIKIFEDFLRGQEVLKIVTTGGSSDEGSNIGIRILSKVNLTELLSSSNMSIIKHIHKKGERIVISCKTQ
jgi:hypothetical protein